MMLPADSLAQRIVEAMARGADRATLEPLAAEYAALCRETNQRLGQFERLAACGQAREALWLAEAPPPVSCLVAAANFNGSDQWRQLCRQLHLAHAPQLNSAALKLLEEHGSRAVGKPVAAPQPLPEQKLVKPAPRAATTPPGRESLAASAVKRRDTSPGPPQTPPRSGETARGMGPIRIGSPAAVVSHQPVVAGLPPVPKTVWLGMNRTAVFLAGGGVLLIAIVLSVVVGVALTFRSVPDRSAASTASGMTGTQAVTAVTAVAPVELSGNASPPARTTTNALSSAQAAVPLPSVSTTVVSAVGAQMPPSRASVVSVPAVATSTAGMSNNASGFPIYVATEQTDIKPLVERHCGALGSAEVIDANCVVHVVKCNGHWPGVTFQESPAEIVSGRFYVGGKPVLKLRAETDWKLTILPPNADWLLCFSPKKPDAGGLFGVLLSAGGDVAPLILGTEALEVRDRQVVLSSDGVARLRRLIPSTGAVRLTMMVEGESRSSVHEPMQASRGLAPCDYSLLAIGLGNLEADYDKRIGELRAAKANIQAQLDRLKAAQQLIQTTVPFSNAARTLTERCQLKRPVQMDFAEFWRRSPQSRQRSAPVWSDYSQYLEDASVRLLAELFNGPVQPQEQATISAMLRNPTAPEFRQLPERISQQFGSKFRKNMALEIFPPGNTTSSGSVNSSPTAGRTSSPPSFANRRRSTIHGVFAEEWKRIFTWDNVVKLAPLLAGDDEPKHARQMRDHDAQIQALTVAKSNLPRTRDPLQRVRLEWQPAAGHAFIPLVEFRKTQI